MEYNFNVSPRCGKTYYEINKTWKDLKKDIKNILDSPQMSRYEKILDITARLEDYRLRYLKGSDKE